MKTTESWMPNFLALVRNGVPDMHAARMARVGWDRVVEKRRTDQDFAEAWAAAVSAKST